MTTDTTKYFSLPNGDVIPVPIPEYEMGRGRRKFTKGFKRRASAFIRTAIRHGGTNKDVAALLGISSSVVSYWGSAKLRAKKNAHANAVSAAKRGEKPVPKARTTTKAHTNGAVPANHVPSDYSLTLARMLTMLTGQTITKEQVDRAANASALILGVA